MSKQLVHDMGDGPWNDQQRELFNQVSANYIPQEEEYQNNIEQKLHELQERANTTAQTPANPEESNTTPNNTNDLQVQKDEAQKKLDEVSAENQNQNNQLQQKQAENNATTEKINHEKQNIEQIQSALNQISSAQENQNAEGNEAAQNLTGEINEIENS